MDANSEELHQSMRKIEGQIKSLVIELYTLESCFMDTLGISDLALFEVMHRRIEAKRVMLKAIEAKQIAAWLDEGMDRHCELSD